MKIILYKPSQSLKGHTIENKIIECLKKKKFLKRLLLPCNEMQGKMHPFNNL